MQFICANARYKLVAYPVQTCTMARMRHVRGSDSGTGGRQRESRTYCRTSCVQFVCANVRYKPLGYPAQTCTMAQMRHVRGSDSVAGGRQRESEPMFAPMRVTNCSGILRKCNHVTLSVTWWGSDSVAAGNGNQNPYLRQCALQTARVSGANVTM